jgi:molybdopterin/thiamine biosynthesis adenylyltransferase
MDDDYIERYSRQLILKEIGGPGQNLLSKARIAIIGAGGLGGPASMYLAAAGVGSMTIIDNDCVETSNLQRQIQFSTSTVGKEKSGSLSERLIAINPSLDCKVFNERINKENAKNILSDHDILIDCVDNFETRFIVNDLALYLKIPLVSGAIGKFEGQVSTFLNTKDSPCYRCFVPEIPPDAETCSQLGVIGATAGIIGSMMALEAIKIITQAGNTLNGKIFIFKGLEMISKTIKLPKDLNCVACSKKYK